MKNYLEAGSDKIRRPYNALYASFTPGRAFVGVLSFILILLSFIGAFAAINSPLAIAATATVAANSGMKYTLAFDDMPTPTTTPSPTSTPTPSVTPTLMPTPTSTSIPSPTATAKPSPIPTTTRVSTPPPSSTISISPARASSTANTNATPVATSTVTAVSPQNSVQGQTPTTTSNSNTPQSTPQEQQKNAFPFIALAIGVPGITATLVFLLIGWWLLRKRLLPINTVQLPPSGANPWSRVRPNDTLATHVNGAFQHDGNYAQLSNSQVPWGNNSIAPTVITFNKNVATPTPSRFAQANTNSFAPSVGQYPPNELNQIPNVQLISAPGPATSETNIPQTLGKNGNSVNASDAYEQWLRNNSTGTPDLNDPYLKELLKQFSDKTRATHLQNLSNFRNEQTNSTPNDAQRTY